MAAGCGASDSSSAKPGAIDVVVTTTQLGDIVRAVGGDAVAVHQILKPNTDPHDYEPRPEDIQRPRAPSSWSTSGDDLDRGWARSSRQRRRRPGRARRRCGRAGRAARRGRGPEASRFDPHWWHDPRNVEAAIARIRDALAKADPRRDGDDRRQRRGLPRQAARARRRDREVHRRGPRRAAQARHRPRRLRLLRPPLRHRRRRRRDPVADDAGPAVGRRPREAERRSIEREHVQAIFPESSINPKLADAIARETGASADHTLYGDTLGPAGSTARPTSAWRPPTPTRWSAASPAERGAAPSPGSRSGPSSRSETAYQGALAYLYTSTRHAALHP